MTITTIGDLAQSYIMRRQNSDLNNQLGSLLQELSSGRTADPATHLGGSYSYLADVERSLSLNDGYDTATAEVRVVTDTMQSALEAFQTVSADLGLDMISSAESNIGSVMTTMSERAAGDVGLLLSKMNTSVGGRFLFGGIASDTAPMADAETIFAALRTELAGETSLAGIDARLDAWFGVGGGFETVAYQGDTTSLAPFRLGAGESVNLDLRADETAIRDLLKHAAKAALAADPVLGYDNALQKEMLLSAGKSLTSDQTGLTQIRADLGYAQARIDESAVRLSAERTSLQIARTELLSVDPYESVTRLENVQFQLEALYTVTARLSRLSLTDYLS